MACERECVWVRDEDGDNVAVSVKNGTYVCDIPDDNQTGCLESSTSKHKSHFFHFPLFIVCRSLSLRIA